MAWGDDQGKSPWGNSGNTTGNNQGSRSGPQGPSGSKEPPRAKAAPAADVDELIAKLQEHLRRMFGGGNGGQGGNGRSQFSGGSSQGIILIGAALFGLWGASGFYKVDSKEVGVVQRFGKFSSISTPGLRYHLPFPIESVTKLGVLNINTVEVGFRGSLNKRQNNYAEGLQKEKLMLTGDQNIIEISFDVQWKIDATRPQDFLFNVRDAEDSIRPVAESAMREIIGKVNITSVLSKQEEKLKVELDARNIMQKTLDGYRAGVQIEKVNLLAADPPSAVIDAFRDVKTAEQDKETTQNQARAYANEVVPRARGEAEKLIQEAEGYKQSVVAEAKGDASRFLAVYNQYVQARDVTSKRIYLETMEAVLKNMKKVVVDSKGGQGVVPVLPLPAMQQPAPPPSPKEN